MEHDIPKFIAFQASFTKKHVVACYHHKCLMLIIIMQYALKHYVEGINSSVQITCKVHLFRDMIKSHLENMSP
jgi:hypothetical protein